MINPYRSLGANLPERLPGARDALPADPRGLRAWVERLPRANQQAYQKELMRALHDFRGRQLDGFSRLEAMEVLRPMLLEAITLLTSRLQGSSFPLTEGKADTGRQLLMLQSELALGYRMAVVEACAPAGKVPFLRGGPVALALTRAMYHHLRWLATSYFLYRPPEPGAWQQLYALAAYASAHRLDSKAVEDPAERRTLSTGLLQNQAVLMALANPYRYSQRELTELWTLTRDLAASIEMTPERFAAGGALALIDTDLPPTFMSRAPDPREGDVLWVDMRKLDAFVRGVLSRAGNDSEAMVRLGRDHRMTVSRHLLERALEGWSQDLTRASLRLDGGFTLDTVVGLSALHYHLAGQLDFDSFMREVRGVSTIALDRASWAHAGTDAASAPIAAARILDQSLGGYRLRWDASQGVRARIGEVVALSLPMEEDGRDWMIGVVRWLRYDDLGMEAGIDLLTRRGYAVGLRVLDEVGSAQVPIRALGLMPLSGEETDLERFLLPARMELAGAQLEVARSANRWAAPGCDGAQVYTCGNAQILRQAGDYRLMEATRI